MWHIATTDSSSFPDSQPDVPISNPKSARSKVKSGFRAVKNIKWRVVLLEDRQKGLCIGMLWENRVQCSVPSWVSSKVCLQRFHSRLLHKSVEVWCEAPMLFRSNGWRNRQQATYNVAIELIDRIHCNLGNCECYSHAKTLSKKRCTDTIYRKPLPVARANKQETLGVNWVSKLFFGQLLVLVQECSSKSRISKCNSISCVFACRIVHFKVRSDADRSQNEPTCIWYSL